MNLQKKESKIASDGNVLDIVDIFDTIQGEGPFSGERAIFIRLAGCNLMCPMCDTDYTSHRIKLTVETIISKAKLIRRNGLVVITGGEPFRQELGNLIKRLIYENYYVQIETNGTLPPPEGMKFSFDLSKRCGAYIICSPKTTKINDSLRLVVSAFKYVIAADSVSAEDGLPIQALKHKVQDYVQRPWVDCPVYIQPEDSGNPDINWNNVQATIDSCKKFGYTMQVQLHKLIGVN